MPETRRSARLANASSDPATSPTKTGSKRKATASPKGGKGKIQKTLEETVNGNGFSKDDAVMENEKKSEDALHEEPNGTEKEAESDPSDGSKTAADGQLKDTEPKSTPVANTGQPDSLIGVKSKDSTTDGIVEDGSATPSIDESAKAPKYETNKSADGPKPEDNGDLIDDETARDDTVASNIMEKGIIYFFTRGRVNVDDPDGVQDLQRTYFVLRPVPTGAKLGEGPIDDSDCNRLIALPKKVFPKSGKDRFMCYVEKAKVSMSRLKDEFFQGSDYETKAGDARHTPAVMPIGEGVYAITKTGRTGHLAYMLTIPKEPGELQAEIGIRTKGSFILSLKNPKSKGPANAQLPTSPEFPQDILDDFGGLAWMAVQKPEYLDYPNAQLLLIGEHEGKFGSSLKDTDKEQNAEEELEKLEAEDQVRIEALHGDDAVYEDLHIRRGQYSELKTTW